MSLTAISIVLISAVMHATWNLLVRSGRSELRFIRRMLSSAALIGLAPAIVCEFWLGGLGWSIWLLAGASGVCCGVYFLGLGNGYEQSDFTIVYPVARALPVLMLAAADTLIGRPPSAAGWAGMVLVVIGCLFAPLTSLADLRLRTYRDGAIVWMALAACGTVGYSLLDKTAAERLQAAGLTGPGASIRYTYYFFAVAAVVYAAFLRLNRKSVTDTQPIGLVRPTLAGLINLAAYSLIVWAMQLTNQVSYIVACRQFSIVVGVMLAFVIFKERGRGIRSAAAVLITAGLVLISLGG